MPLRQGGGPGIPSAGSITLTGDVTGTAAATVVSAISGASPILITPSVLEWTAGTATPTLTQATPTSDVAAVNLVVQAQSAEPGAVTNVTGANLALQAGAAATSNGNGGSVVAVAAGGTGTGTSGYFYVNVGGASYFSTGGAMFAGNFNGAWLGKNVAQSTSNYSFLGDGVTLSALNAPTSGTVAFRINNANELAVTSTSVALTPPSLSWVNTATAPNVIQLALASTSAGSGAAGQAMSVTAQAGQAATGASNNGGNGGTLTLAAGAGGTSGSATAGIRGLIGMLGLVGGSGTTPFGWAGQTSPNTVACGTGGTQTISAAQAIIPFFLVTTGTLSSNAVVDFSTNASTGYFIVDLSGVGTLGAFTLGFKNGTTTKTITATQLTALIGTGATAGIIVTYGTNNITILV